MLYRDFMQKYRPLYSPDGPAAGGSGATDGAAAAAGSSAAPPATEASSPAPAAVDAGAAAAPAAPAADAAPAAAAEVVPSLLEAAAGKPKPDAAAAKSADGADVKESASDPGTKEPAPADAAKPDAKDAKTDGNKPADDAAKDAAEATDPDKKDATAETQPPAPIKYEAFKTPEGIKLDDERIGKFAEIAGPAQVSQEVAQQFLDLHIAEMQRMGQEAIANARKEQVKAWNTYVDSITTDLRKDSEVGGNRLETSLSMAKAVVQEYLPANEAAEYLALLTHNGMGNHRLQVKLLQKIGQVLNIFEDGMVPANPQAPKAQKGPGNRGWYDKTPAAS